MEEMFNHLLSGLEDYLRRIIMDSRLSRRPQTVEILPSVIWPPTVGGGALVHSSFEMLHIVLNEALVYGGGRGDYFISGG